MDVFKIQSILLPLPITSKLLEVIVTFHRQDRQHEHTDTLIFF